MTFISLVNCMSAIDPFFLSLVVCFLVEIFLRVRSVITEMQSMRWLCDLLDDLSRAFVCEIEHFRVCWGRKEMGRGCCGWVSWLLLAVVLGSEGIHASQTALSIRSTLANHAFYSSFNEMLKEFVPSNCILSFFLFINFLC